MRIEVERNYFTLDKRLAQPFFEKPSLVDQEEEEDNTTNLDGGTSRPTNLPLASSHKNGSIFTSPETDTSFGGSSTRSDSAALFSIRDTSIDGGPGGVETSRITVNTHNSILNITEEDEDEEGSEVPLEKSYLLGSGEGMVDDDGSILLDHRSVTSDGKSTHNSTGYPQCIPRTPPTCTKSLWKSSWFENRPPSACSSSSTTGSACGAGSGAATGSEHVAKKDLSLLDFFDRLCYTAATSSSTTPGVAVRPTSPTVIPASASSSSSSLKKEKDAVIVWEQYQRVLEYDIMELLGCSSPPGQDELNRVWHFNLVPLSGCNPPAVPSTYSSDCGALSVGDTIADDDDAQSSQGATTPLTAPSLQQRKSRRRQWRERAMYVHCLRMEQNSSPTSVASPMPLSIPSLLVKCRSMDDDLWSPQNKHGTLMELTWNSALKLFYSTQEEKPPDPLDAMRKSGGRRDWNDSLQENGGGGGADGYDSDPEERRLPLNRSSRSSSRHDTDGLAGTTNLQTRRAPIDPAFLLDSGSVYNLVQETLNMSWTVRWYPRNSDNTLLEPRTVHAWIERGTLIEMNTVMLEPNLMWREAFHPELNSKRRLNASSQKPHFIRLLNLCRVLVDDIDQSIYPLVRPSCCVLIRTSDGQEHLFETRNKVERNELVRRWKLTTARFATLAVLEDLETICREFFSPMISSRMLVPDYSTPTLSITTTQVEEEDGQEILSIDDDDLN